MTSVFKRNLAALAPREPELARRLSGVAPAPDDGAAPASGGVEINLEGARMAVILGMGDGRLFTQAARQSPPGAALLLIEPDERLFARTLRRVDVSTALGNERVSVSVGESPRAATIGRAEAMFNVFTLRRFAIAREPESMTRSRAYFMEVERHLEQLRQLGLQNALTLEKLGPLWRGNILDNLPAIVAAPPVNALFGAWEGHAAAVVAAGPSLNRNARRLAAAKGRMAIIAVDTAARPLLAAGVEPDIVVSLDPQYENHLHLRGLSLPRTILALNPAVHPLTVARRTGPAVFMSYVEPLMEWVEELAGERGFVRTGGSVATCAFDLAFKLGCRPVVFVGQDMAYTGGVTHADGTNHSALGTRGFLSAPAADAPDDYRDYTRDDLFGRRARTNAKMETWRRWFELVIAHDNLSALNATEGGLPIEGAPGVSLDEAIARHARSKPLPSLAARLIRLAAPDTRPLREGLAAARAEALAVASACRRALPELKSALAGGLDSARAASRLDRLANLAGAITRRELFYRLTRWSVDAALDEVEELKLAAQGQGEAAQRAASLKGYQTLFSRLHELAAEFEGKLRAAESALAGQMKAAS